MAIIRDSTQDDVEAIQAIYAIEVLDGLASFEEVPPGVDAMRSRREAVLAQGLPYLAAESDGQVVGYCYASLYRIRPAYRNTLEDSVYVARGMQGLGVGRALLSTLITRCERGPWRQMLAIIAHGEQTGSIALHERLGFRHVGRLEAVGYKQGHWLDTVVMQRALGPGSAVEPDPRTPA
ncbi:MAG: N-acetyltransferase family protein [Pseudomonadota bacterium]